MMKMLRFIFRQFPFFLLLCGLFFSQCHCGPKIKFNPAIQTPLAISFLDADKLLDLQIAKVHVTIIAPDSSVVTANGLPVSTIDIEGGVMCLGLKRDVKISEATPYQFTIKAEADGYSTVYRKVLLDKQKQVWYIPVYLTNLGAPPPGMATDSGQFSVTDATIKNAIRLSPKIANKVSRTAWFDIKAGTVFWRDGKPVSAGDGNLSYSIVYGEANRPAAERAFPGGSLITNALDPKTNTVYATPQRPAYFESTGWVTLEVEAGGTQVNQLSEEMDLTMPISANLINPITQKEYRSDDNIMVWSLNESGTWMLERLTPVEKDSNGLYVRFPVKHLSTWNLGFIANACTEDQKIAYTYSDSVNTSLRRYTELIDVQTGKPFLQVSGIYSYFFPGDTLTISHAPANKQMVFRVYATDSAPDSTLQTTKIFKTCVDTPQSLVIIPDNAPVFRANLTFEVIANGSTKFNPMCNNAVWYKLCPTCNPTRVSSNTTPGPDDDPDLFCATTNRAFSFGGVAVTEPVAPGQTFATAADITLAQRGLAFDAAGSSVYCIRLWYAGLSPAGETVAETIDFPINFGYTATAVQKIKGRKLVNGGGSPIPVEIEHTYIAGIDGTNLHRITIRNGISILAQCEPPISDPIPVEDSPE